MPFFWFILASTLVLCFPFSSNANTIFRPNITNNAGHHGTLKPDVYDSCQFYNSNGNGPVPYGVQNTGEGNAWVSASAYSYGTICSFYDYILEPVDNGDYNATDFAVHAFLDVTTSTVYYYYVGDGNIGFLPTSLMSTNSSPDYYIHFRFGSNFSIGPPATCSWYDGSGDLLGTSDMFTDGAFAYCDARNPNQDNPNIFFWPEAGWNSEEYALAVTAGDTHVNPPPRHIAMKNPRI
jgi:hypothetical protein